jgi:hypothetical protein
LIVFFVITNFYFQICSKFCQFCQINANKDEKVGIKNKYGNNFGSGHWKTVVHQALGKLACAKLENLGAFCSM